MQRNEIQVFNHKEFGGFRALQIDGQPWFVGKEVASVLGYGDAADGFQGFADRPVQVCYL